MNDFDPSLPSPEIIARANLSEIVKNADYITYAQPRIPLMLNAVNQEQAATDEFSNMFHKYRWPDEHDKEMITGKTKIYENDREFLYYLRVYSDEPEERDKYLNNFNVWLRTKPQEEFDPVNMQDATYGMQPALHRAYAIAPDLMENLQVFFSQSYEKFKGRADEMTEFLAQPTNADVIKAAHMAYRILGRLVKHTDQILQMDNMYSKPEVAKPIIDVHKALTA